MKNPEKYLENKFVYSYPKLERVPVVSNTILGKTICVLLENVGVVTFPNRAYGEKERVKYFFSIYDLINYHNVNQRLKVLNEIVETEYQLKELTERLEKLKTETDLNTELISQYVADEIKMKQEKYKVEKDYNEAIAKSAQYYNTHVW